MNVSFLVRYLSLLCVFRFSVKFGLNTDDAFLKQKSKTKTTQADMRTMNIWFFHRTLHSRWEKVWTGLHILNDYGPPFRANLWVTNLWKYFIPSKRFNLLHCSFNSILWSSPSPLWVNWFFYETQCAVTYLTPHFIWLWFNLKSLSLQIFPVEMNLNCDLIW